MTIRSWTRVAAILVVSGFAAPPARATDYTWIASGGGLFQDGNNWTPGGGPPGVTDTAIFGSPSGNNPVTFSSDVSTSGLRFDQGVVAFQLTPGQQYFVLGIDGFSVGAVSGQTATLQVTGGTLRLIGSNIGAGVAGIGAIAGSTGNLTISDPGAGLSAVQSLAVGNGGAGTLTVQNGATAGVGGDLLVGRAATADGLVLVVGLGSTATISGKAAIGELGTGALTVDGGGAVSILQRVEIAYNAPAGATGSVTIGGTGTGSLSCGGLSIGSFAGATSSLTINSGSTINVGAVTFVTAGATINMNGTWNQNAGNLQMTDGTFNLTGGSFNQTTAVTIISGGQFNISGGSHTVSTIGRLFTAQLNHGDGTLTVKTRFDNGTGNHVINGLTATSNPVLTLDGGATTNMGQFTVGVDRRGTVNAVNGGQLNVNGLALGVLLGSEGTALAGAGSAIRPTVTNSAVGFSGKGTLVLNGGEFATNGRTVFAGVSETGNGTIDVNGGSFSTLSAPGVGGQLQVGVNGQGSLLVRNGGSASSEASFVGVFATGMGTAVVSGAGSTWTNTQLSVGYNGNGALTVQAGGVVNSDFGLVGYSGALARGVVNMNSGTWNVAGAVEVGDQFGFGGAGVIHVNPGGNLSTPTGDILLHAGGLINLAGGTVTANNIIGSGGNMAWSSGALVVNSNLNVESAVFGPGITLGLGHALSVANQLTVPMGQTLRLNGGTIRAGSVVADGSLVLTSGSFELTGSTLSIGSGGLVGSQMNVGPELIVKVAPANGQVVAIAADGVLNLTGGTVQGNVVSSGEINFLNPASTLGAAGRSLTNTGRLAGAGQVNSDLTNNANGRVIVDAGQRLRFAGTTNNNNANGTIEMTGGTVEFTGTLNNNAGAQISGRGTFRGSSANTSGVGLNNTGSVAFSAGLSDVFGKVQNTGMGNILTVGAGTTTFHDDVVHNGAEIRTTAGARTVFLGTVSGSGPFTGTGVVEFDGDLRPGNSPGSIAFAGDFVFGHSATLQAEIGGGVPGSGYDQLNVTGSVSFDGTFQLTLLNGFAPIFGQRFDIVNFGSRQGTFSSYAGLVLPNGLTFVPGFDGQSFYLTAVPEPTSIILTGVVAGTALVWRQRSKRRVAPAPGIDYDAG